MEIILERQAVLSWKSGQVAILSVDGGWQVSPADPTLLAILEREYGLARVQGLRETTLPSLLACAARRAGDAMGAEVRIEFECVT